jgi:Ser/Thr protein kinase RdoA (MazF antagonist)
MDLHMNELMKSDLFPEEEVKRVSKECFGLDVCVKPLVGFRDWNFYLEDKTGGTFVLKISYSEEKRELLEAQNAAMDHIARYAGEHICPTVCASLDGDSIIVVKDKNGISHFARTLVYVPGKVIRESGYPIRLMEDFGSFLGNMARYLENFSHPALHGYSDWDIKHTMDLRQYYPEIKDSRKRELFNHFLGQFETFAVPLFPQLRTAVVHADANDYNVLIDEDETRICGIIDFEGLVHSYIVSEPAIAAAYAIHWQEQPLDIITRILAGYHRAYPLTPAELAVLFFMIPARLCATVGICLRQQTLDPDNPYVGVSVAPAWAALEKLSAIDPGYAHHRFRQACNLP